MDDTVRLRLIDRTEYVEGSEGYDTIITYEGKLYAAGPAKPLAWLDTENNKLVPVAADFELPPLSSYPELS